MPTTVDPPYLHPDYVATRLRAPARPLLAAAGDAAELDRAGVRRRGASTERRRAI